MMVRLVALALNAWQLQSVCNGDGILAFGAGLSDPNDPDLSLKDFTGLTRLWVEVGQPEEKPIAKACQKADQVILYPFNHAAEVWWRGIENKLARLDKLQVWRVPTEASQALTPTGAAQHATAGDCSGRQPEPVGQPDAHRHRVRAMEVGRSAFFQHFCPISSVERS